MRISTLIGFVGNEAHTICPASEPIASQLSKRKDILRAGGKLTLGKGKAAEEVKLTKLILMLPARVSRF